jgi:hypothetical protein
VKRPFLGLAALLALVVAFAGWRLSRPEPMNAGMGQAKVRDTTAAAPSARGDAAGAAMRAAFRGSAICRHWPGTIRGSRLFAGSSR